MITALLMSGFVSLVHADDGKIFTNTNQSLRVSVIKTDDKDSIILEFKKDKNVVVEKVIVEAKTYSLGFEDTTLTVSNEADTIFVHYSMTLASLDDPSHTIIRDDVLEISLSDDLEKDTFKDIPSNSLVSLPDKEDLESYLNDDEYLLFDQEMNRYEIKKRNESQGIVSSKKNNSVRVGQKLSYNVNFFWKQNPSYAWQFPGGFSEIMMDSFVVFCLEPTILQTETNQASLVNFDTLDEIRIMDGRLHTTLSKTQKEALRLIANYGYGYPGHESLAYRWATQILIYEAIGWEFESYGTLNPMQEISQIQKLIKRHNDKPSWQGKTLEIKKNEIVDLSDPSLSNYNFNMQKSKGVELVEGKGATFKFKVVRDEATIVFDEKLGNPIGTSSIFWNGTSQRVGSFKNKEPRNLNVNFKVSKGNLVIEKWGTDGAKYPGVVFEISRDKQIILQTIKTDTNGNATLNNLETGTYYVREKSVPLPLLLNTQWHAIAVESNATATLKITNTLIQGVITILKRNDSGNPIEGVVFEVRDNKGATVQTLKTNKSGKAVSQNLPLGAYTLHETYTPKPYVLSDKTYKVVLSATDSTKPIVYETLEIQNKHARGGVLVEKLDSNGDPIQGVRFELRTPIGDPVRTVVTDTLGHAFFDNVELGEYLLVETHVPAPYVLDDTPRPISLKYLDQHTPKVIFKQSVTNTFQRANLRVIKQEDKWDETFHEYHNKALESVSFSLIADEAIYEGNVQIHAKGETVARGKSDSGGVIRFNNLALGNYLLHEDESREGYQLPETSWPVTLTYQEENNTLALFDHNITIHNRVIYGHVKLVKENDINERLTDVVFDLFNVDGTYVNRYTTDEIGELKVNNLRYGSYYFIEVETFEGHVINTEPIHFQIKNQDEMIELNVSNPRFKAWLKLIKQNFDTHKPLANAQFKIKNRETSEYVSMFDEYGDTVDSWASDASGNVDFQEMLPYGFYTLEEVVAPQGYRLGDPIDFNINENSITESGVDGNVLVIVANNTSIKGNLKILKVDGNSKESLEGAVFEVKAHKDGSIHRLVSGEDGIAILEGLEYGTYTVREVEAAPGYLLNKQTFEIEVQHHDQWVHLEVENFKPTGRLILEKIDSKSKAPLEGVAFKVTKVGKGTNIFENVSICNTTDSKGLILFENLPLGKYIVEETVPLAGYPKDSLKHLIDFEYADDATSIIEKSLVIENSRKKVRVEVLKVDSNTGHEIKSNQTQFQLRDAHNTPVDLLAREGGRFVWEVDDLESYFLHEISAPEGYLREIKPLEIVLSGDKEFKRITFNNDPLPSIVLPTTGIPSLNPLISLLCFFLGLALILYRCNDKR